MAVLAPEQEELVQELIQRSLTAALEAQRIEYERKQSLLEKIIARREQLDADRDAAAARSSTARQMEGDDRLVDVKFGKLTPFINKEEDFEEWSFKVKSGVSSFSTDAGSLFTAIEECSTVSMKNSEDITKYKLEQV